MIQFKAHKVPLYLQVKEYIKQNIDEKKWVAGSKLPTERELAQALQVSRKTISLAYEELKKEGIISSQQGRGTFVINRHAIQKDVNLNQLTENIDRCIEISIKMGLELEEFLDLCGDRVNRYIQKLKKIKLVFIECNKEQLDYFCKELELGAGVTITPILLEDFKKNIKEINDKIKTHDLIVTTFFHIDEVKSLVKNNNIKILPIALNPQLGSIIQIARIDRNSKVGILTISQNFADKVKNAILEAGLCFDKIQAETTTELDEVKKFAHSHDVIIVSPGRKKDVLPFKEEKDIIEFIFVPDTGSINLLKSAIFKEE